MHTHVPSLPSRKVILWMIAGFLLVMIAIYGQSLRNGFVGWDDGMLITENPAVRVITPASLRVIFTHFDPELYIPLTFMSYQLDYQIGGDSPVTFHLDNLLLHTVDALLIVWFVYLLTKGRKGMALAVGLLFAVHPLNTEAVAWASGRKDVLSALFFLISLITYMYYRADGSRRKYWGSVIAFFLGLLAKVMVITLPVVLLLLDWRERRKWTKEMLLEKVPYFLLSVIFGLVALLGKTQVLSQTTLLTKVLLAFRSAVFYVQKFFWPMGISVVYPYNGTVSLAMPEFLLSVVAVLAVIGLALWTLKWTREIVFGVFFYLLVLSPTFTNLAKGKAIFLASDRYAYLPSIGLLWVVVLLAMVVWGGWERVVSPLLQRWLPLSVLCVLVLSLGWKAHMQSLTWKDTESLFRNVLAYYPDDFSAHNNIGNALRREGKLDEAVAELKASLAGKPTAKTWGNLGAVYQKQGKIAEAIAAFQEGSKVDPTAPEPFMGLGILYAATGDPQKALQFYSQAIQVDPQYTQARVNRGALLLDHGQTDAAIADEREALRLDPLSAEARFDLALALLKQGKNDEAIMQLQTAVKYRSDFLSAHLNLAVLLYQAGRMDEAKQQFVDVLRLDPTNALARAALQKIASGV